MKFLFTNKYFLSLVGIFGYLLLLFVLNKIGFHLKQWRIEAKTYVAVTAMFYLTCAQFVVCILGALLSTCT